ncbi:MAG: ADP-ribosylation factor-like protein [Thermoanaerobaculia bacterium]
MALFNHTTRELTAKIVYYGPALGGKTTNLRTLHARLDHAATGKLLSLATAQERTIYFDLLPVELGNIKGYTVRFQLCTVPGQVFYNETRKIVLRGVDGIVFVVDSQPAMLSHDLESFQNLRENLREEKIALESLPVVIQYNKRDLPASLPVAALQESLGFAAYPFVEASATQGTGIVETFHLVSKLTFVDLLRRLQKGDPGVNETASAAFVAATETVPALGSEAPETVFAHADAAPSVVHEAAAVITEPEPPRFPPAMAFEGLGLEEDSEAWESTSDDTGPDFDDEPPLDSSLVTSELPAEADLATTRAIQTPEIPPHLLLPEESAAAVPEAATTEPTDSREPKEPTDPADHFEPAEPSPPPPPAPLADTGREEAEARLNARLTALEEEVSTLRSELAESRNREDSLQARTEELKRRWDSLRKLLSEDGPTAG